MVNGIDKIVRVENILYVPGLAANLLSVDAIVRRNYRVNFAKNVCTIHDAYGELAVAISIEAVYKLHKASETALHTTLRSNAEAYGISVWDTSAEEQ